MRITVGETFNYENNKYRVARLPMNDYRKYQVYRFETKYNAWYPAFKADTLREVMEILER